MNRFLFALALGLVAESTAQAAVIDLTPVPQAGATLPLQPRVPNLAPTPHLEPVVPPAHMSELPEPEVFAMMLVGLVLLGYRSRRRDSNEKFK